jgi:outer membrane protein assembly factor BamB
LWKQELTGEFYSSPVVVGDKVYATTRQGLTHVFKAGDHYEKLGQGDVGEAVDSSPAVAGDSLYLRGEKHLFCVAEETK